MRVMIFHGYLLAGTGSNVYNARLAEALSGLGHEVHLLCQDRHPDRQPFVHAAGDWDEGSLRVRELREPGPGFGRCSVYRPDIGGLLPVYVRDRYEGIEARTFAECSDGELDRYLAANVAAVRELVARVRPDVALANHLVMGPVILARALGGVPYAVKVHGSALEYTVKPQPERFLAPAREGLAPARAVLVGSRHTALSLWSAIDDPALAPRTRLGPPGVDVERFAPRSREAASAGLRALVERLRGADAPQPQDPASAFSRDARAAADALERVGGDDAPLVAFVGKLIVSKGVDLLLAAWPLVLEQEPAARLALVGFGAFRAPLERLCAAFAAGDLEQARQIALAGRSLEDASVQPRPLAHLLAFLDSLVGAERERYLRAAREMRERVAFVGRLEHDELAELLPACRALVVPSTFPEAFGMVAVEAAACAVLPISAAHSGLAEVSEALAASVAELDPWQLSFAVDHTAVRAIAARVLAWLQSDPDRRSRVGAELVRAVRERWSWQSVARGVLAAGGGEIGSLQAP